VLRFKYGGCRETILDTPGHQDFSEDTYRTLMAADSAVMLIDVAKGVEAQTKKLFAVSKERGIPIFTFVNKIDHFGRSPFDLMEEIENVLGIRTCPMNWPIGINGEYKGVYDREHETIELFAKDETHGQEKLASEKGALTDPRMKELLGDDVYQALLDDIELLDVAGDPFDFDKVRAGELTPMFFGSAMTNFGVKPFLEKFLELAPSPAPRQAIEEMVQPTSEDFSALVFKIQANMDPNHHDRIVFMRICSGKFEQGMNVTLNRTKRTIRMAHTTQFMADTREEVQEAVAGDIIGLYDTGNLQIGDTLYTGNAGLQFKPLPQFTPELFMKVTPKNVMKQKSFHKGIEQLVQEGAIQLYKTYHTEEYIIGAVGQLQFEVFQYRLLHEYNAEVDMTPIGNKIARWIDEKDLNPNMSSSRNLLAKDRFGQPVFLFENAFAENWFKDKYPDIELKKLL